MGRGTDRLLAKILLPLVFGEAEEIIVLGVEYTAVLSNEIPEEMELDVWIVNEGVPTDVTLPTIGIVEVG